MTDRLFLKSLGVTAGFVLGSTVPVWVISLGMAVLFFQKFPGREAFKVLFFTPLAAVAGGDRGGMENTPASARGYLVRSSASSPAALGPGGSMTCNFLPSCPSWCMIGISPRFTCSSGWRALTAIPSELRDAARVDGANRLRSFIHIELPLLRPTAVFVATPSRPFAPFRASPSSL